MAAQRSTLCVVAAAQRDVTADERICLIDWGPAGWARCSPPSSPTASSVDASVARRGGTGSARRARKCTVVSTRSFLCRRLLQTAQDLQGLSGAAWSDQHRAVSISAGARGHARRGVHEKSIRGPSALCRPLTLAWQRSWPGASRSGRANPARAPRTPPTARRWRWRRDVTPQRNGHRRTDRYEQVLERIAVAATTLRDDGPDVVISLNATAGRSRFRSTAPAGGCTPARRRARASVPLRASPRTVERARHPLDHATASERRLFGRTGWCSMALAVLYRRQPVGIGSRSPRKARQSRCTATTAERASARQRRRYSVFENRRAGGRPARVDAGAYANVVRAAWRIPIPAVSNSRWSAIRLVLSMLCAGRHRPLARCGISSDVCSTHRCVGLRARAARQRVSWMKSIAR